MTSTALAAAAACLLGSSIQPAVFKVEGKPDVQLGTVVARAHELSGLSVDQWNALPDAEREEKIIAVLREWELPVYHQAKVQVIGAENMTLQQQADTIRLNPGVEGFPQEAYELAAKQANDPLPEHDTLPIPAGAAPGAASPDTSNAPASAIAGADTPTPAHADAAGAPNGEVEAQNKAAALAQFPPQEPKTGPQGQFTATVSLSPAGDCKLITFNDGRETHSATTEEQIAELTQGYIVVREDMNA